MKWNKSTRLGLYAALEIAAAGDALVSAGTIAEKYRVSTNHLAKVLQALQRAGLVRSTRGVGGGYRLARPPSEISLLDVVEVFEGTTDLQRCLLADEASDDSCANRLGCRLKRVFDEIEHQAYFTLKSIRLSALVPGGA